MTTMIVPEAALRAALGLLPNITEHQRMLVALAHREANAAVIDHLHYDPVQSLLTEYYPLADRTLRGSGPTGWDVTSDHSRAYEYSLGGARTLQLQSIPVRQIVSVNVDQSAKFGQAPGAFASGTAWTAGVEYWAEFDQPDLCRSGSVFCSGAWPIEPGSVKIVYRAGYSDKELAGDATSSSVATDGTITTARVNAYAIRAAAIMTGIQAFHTLVAYMRKSRAGFVPGSLASERLGEYAYTIGGGAIEAITGMKVAIPAAAADKLEPFVNYAALIGA